MRENTIECNFGIQSAPTPENAIFDDTGKGGLFPICLVHRDNVIVSHQHRRSGVLLARPPQQHRPVRQLLVGANVEHPRIQGR